MRDDLDGPGPASEQWASRLEAYLDAQVGVEHLRAREMPDPPWPDEDNLMLSYLLRRAKEIYDEEGETAAITWVAVHAWYEGALAARSDAIRSRGLDVVDAALPVRPLPPHRHGPVGQYDALPSRRIHRLSYPPRLGHSPASSLFARRGR